jgi:HK97 family phage major capsid protein
VSEDIETVALDEGVADQIAEKTADRVATKAAENENASLREEMAQLKASLEELRTKPVRTEITEAGIKAKPGEQPAFYGGHDKYTDIGETESDTAVLLYLTDKVLQGKSGQKRLSLRGREVMIRSAEAAMKAGPKATPKVISEHGFTKAIDPDGFVSKTYKEFWREAAELKAMTSTGANEGDEWVPTFALADLWRDIHFETRVSASIPRVAMPTNPFDLPTLDSDVTFYYASTENTSVTGSQPNTGKATLTARKIQADVTFSGEVTEDSIIAIAPTIRQNLVRRGAQTIDDLIVHGDTETGATGNVNTDNGAPASGAFYTALNGMRKFALVTNTGQVSNVAAALTTANFTTIRGLLGKYGGRPQDLRIILGQSTLNTIYDIAQVKTVDVYGPNATIVQGELARFFGIPILMSEATPVTDSDLVAADGKSDSTAGTLGWLVLTNVNGWKHGFRREFQIESDRNIQTDSNILVASFRMALIPSGISVKHTAVGRNITV